MIERIKNNEEKLDQIIKTYNELNIALNNFESIEDIIKDINKYYGSKEWFFDKEIYEDKKLPPIKAGVLSEDTVWNINEDIKELLEKMNKLSNRMIQKNQD